MMKDSPARNRDWWRYGLFALFLLLVLLPLVLRPLQSSPVYADDASYYYLRLAQSGSEDILPHASLQHPHFVAILGFLISLLSLPVFIVVWPLLLSIAGYACTLFILRQTRTPHTTWILVLATTTPLFLALHTQLTPFSPGLVLALAGTALFLSRYSYLSWVPIALVPFFDIPLAIISVLLFLGLSLQLRDKIRSFYVVMLATFLVAWWHISATKLLLSGILRQGIIQPPLVELGGSFALTIPLLFLGLLGFFTLWKQDLNKYLLHAIFIGTLIASVSLPSMRIVAAGFLIWYGAEGLAYLLRREWSFPLMQQLTLLVIFCTILFGLVSFLSSSVESPPTAQHQQAASFIEEFEAVYDDRTIVVLLPESIAHYAQYEAGARTLPKGVLFFDAASMRERNATQALLQERTLSQALPWLRQRSVDYVLVTEAQKAFLWNNGENGFYFLLLNAEPFTLIFDNALIEIYQVQPQSS